MFDIGFTEMMIIGIIALLVVGPKDLPKVARKVGDWVARMRRYVDDVKSDINRQVELDELRNIKTEITQAAQSIETSLTSTVADAQKGFNALATEASIGDGSGDLSAASNAAQETDWDRVYAVRRTRQKYKDRRIEREREHGMKRKPIARKF